MKRNSSQVSGNWFQTNDQINFGGHTSRFAYFASVDGNRSNLGLQTPVGEVVHDAENGYGGFASFLFNASPENQFRAVTSLRRDFYQIPYDPDASDWENQLYPSAGLRDVQHEADAFVDFSWVRTINPNLLLTVSPFFHHNSADYTGAPNDTPTSTTDQRSSDFGGLQATLNANFAKNNIQVGIYGFGQHDNEKFGLLFNPINQCPVTSGNPEGLCQNISPPDHEFATGGTVAGFADEKLKVTSWLTLMGGMRPTHFVGTISEDTINPRFGIAAQIPKVNMGFSRFLRSLLPVAAADHGCRTCARCLPNNSNLTFVPLHGERDEEHQFGITIPFRGWALDADTFQTRANNFLDHNNIGESNLFFPVTIDGALINAWEVSAAFSSYLEPRPDSSRLFESSGASARGAITGGSHLFSADAIHPAHPIPATRRSTTIRRNTLNVGFYGKSAVARVCILKCLLRLGIYEWVAESILSGRLFAAAHDV